MYGYILASGLVDKNVLRTLKTKTILNKLRPLRKGWISSLAEGLRQMTSTIKIEKSTNSKQKSAEIRRKDKPVAEIEALQNEENKTRTLGVSTKHIHSTEIVKYTMSRTAMR